MHDTTGMHVFQPCAGIVKNLSGTCNHLSVDASSELLGEHCWLLNDFVEFSVISQLHYEIRHWADTSIELPILPGQVALPIKPKRYSRYPDDILMAQISLQGHLVNEALHALLRLRLLSLHYLYGVLLLVLDIDCQFHSKIYQINSLGVSSLSNCIDYQVPIIENRCVPQGICVELNHIIKYFCLFK